jgi:hypothetical protein
MKKAFLSCVLLCLFQQAVWAQSISDKNLKKHIYYLSSDSLHGREAGSADEQKAGEYIASFFKKYKLDYYPGNNSYFQDFTFKVKTNPHSADSTEGEVRNCRNVVGYINAHASQTIVLGAHYDHLGLGYDHNSLEPNPEGKIHNGADDNASGTAGVMELARVLSAQKGKLKFNIVFCLFSGEELGLAGSKKFVEAYKLDSTKIKYMFNFDMIGRMNDSSQTLLVMGFGTCPEWGRIVTSTNKTFHLKYDSAGVGPSDYTSFYLENIPVLGFFTGQHYDYHKPSDDADRINYKKEVLILEYILRVIRETEKYPTLHFTKTLSKESTNTGFKVTLGIMPDYIFEGKGLRIDGVTEGKPAAKAGLKKGDIIIHFDNLDINDIQDYMKVLAKSKKGDVKKVTVKRGNETITVDVTL